MNKKTIIPALLVLVVLAGQAETHPQSTGVNSTAICETDSSVIDPFYVFETNHAYRIADTQTIPDMGSSQYSVSWYVDTEEWDFNPQSNHIFSKIEFKKGDTVLATFCDDDGWSYIGIENSKAKMFKSFRIDSDHTAVVFRGGIYSDGVSNLTVFVLSGDEVKLVFNKLYSMEKIKKDKIFISADATTLEICGYLSFKDGRISFVSKEYPKGKIIFDGKENWAKAQEVDATIKEFISSMYENKLYYQNDFLETHCSKKLLQHLKDEFEYDGDGYAGWLFRTSSQDIKSGADGVKDKVLSITKDGEGWYHYTFTDGGWHGENKQKVHMENGKVMMDALERVYDECLATYHKN